MKLAPRKRYTPEFKTQAVELLTTGKPVAQVAEERCCSSNLLYSWRHSSQGAQLGRGGARAVVRAESSLPGAPSASAPPARASLTTAASVASGCRWDQRRYHRGSTGDQTRW